MSEVTPSAIRMSVAPSQERLENEVFLEADARTRTADRFITSVDQVPSPVAPSRAKPHEPKESVKPRWRPMTPNGERVDRA
jgi:hypothetical protein